jgi:hypothetical protein
MVADINVSMSGDMRYLRLYADNDGETHFEDVEDEMRVEDFAPPAEPFLVSEIRDATRFSFFEFPAGWIGIAHPAPRRQYFAVVQGAIEITASDGETRTAKLGDVVLAEDTNSKGHVTRVIGDENFIAALTQLE